MKKLYELGISPAPWKVDDREFGCDNEIWCEYISDKIVKGEKRTKIVAKCNAYFDTYKTDARLIAAAPELFDVLQSLVEYIDRECIPCGDTACELLFAARNVLSKAAGEEVGDGK